jgi:transposase
MANQLKMATVDAIVALHQLGWSQRRIAREFGIDRETIGRYVNSRAAGSKPATNAPPGSLTAPVPPEGRLPARRANASPGER